MPIFQGEGSKSPVLALVAASVLSALNAVKVVCVHVHSRFLSLFLDRLAVYAWLSWNLQISTCLYLQNAEVKGVCHPTRTVCLS